MATEQTTVTGASAALIDAVREAASRCEPFGRKVYICDVLAHMGPEWPAQLVRSGLIRAQQAGQVRLARADICRDVAKEQASELAHPMGLATWHFVDLTSLGIAPRDPWAR